MSLITSASVLKINPSTQWRRYLKGIVLDPDLALNETGTEFFTRIDGVRTIEDIGIEIAALFNVDAAFCIKDLMLLAEQLIGEGILIGDKKADSIVA